MSFGVASIGVSIVVTKELAVLADRNVFIAEGMCMAIKAKLLLSSAQLLVLLLVDTELEKKNE